jgi:glycosyltransferase involved in cell wall biosynthesis
MKNVSIIICAYNEEKTIENVVKKCRKYNPKSEVIVVDDGSSDKTEEILLKLNHKVPFKYIRLPENKGKSFAMTTGVKKANHEVILFFDADVTGIKKIHFKQLLTPLLSKEPQVDMVLGYPSETLIDYRVNPFKSLTGERAIFKKDLMPILKNIQNLRFGVETYINMYFQSEGKKLKYTQLNGLIHPTKYNKTTPGKATAEFISEGQEIMSTLFQNYDLITKRIGNNLENQGSKFKDTLKNLQYEINEKLQALLKNNG